MPSDTKACPVCKGTGRVMNPASIGSAYRRRRLAIGVGLRVVAKKLKVSAAYLSDLELGKRDWRNEELRKEYSLLLQRLESEA